MIERMTRYSFVLLNAQKDEFLERLQSLGLVDITRSAKPVDPRSEELLSSIESRRKAIADILAGKDAGVDELRRRIAELQNEKKAAEPWGNFDRTRLEGLGLSVSFFVVPRKKFDVTLTEQFAMEVISEDAQNVYAVVLGDSEGFPGKALTAPSRSIAEIDEATADLHKELEELQKTVEKRKETIPAIESEIAEAKAELNKYLAGVAGVPAAENSILVFEGFAPCCDDEKLAAEFDALDILWLKEEAKVEDNPPIKFRNNRFVKMFEVLTDMYGRPAYNGFDPTPYISVFFLLFFAMCMGDAGYGIVLVILGTLLKKVKSFASLASLVTVLGVATVVVGLFFHTFFSVDLLGLEWIPESMKACMLPSKIAGYDGAMILALGVGILHLCLAMVVKTIYATRTMGFRRSVSVWGWTIFLVGTVAVLAVSLLGVIDTQLCKWLIITLGVISAIGIFPLRTPGKNPVINIGAGLWETYNTATGVLGDVLSYLRLYALGLAGSMLGFAFNDLAKMALGDGGIGGWIAFILIVIIGHTLNVAMAALGAFVHPLRLNFLEFFKNSGYEATGKAFNPLSRN